MWKGRKPSAHRESDQLHPVALSGATLIKYNKASGERFGLINDMAMDLPSNVAVSLK